VSALRTFHRSITRQLLLRGHPARAAWGPWRIEVTLGGTPPLLTVVAKPPPPREGMKPPDVGDLEPVLRVLGCADPPARVQQARGAPGAHVWAWPVEVEARPPGGV